MPFSIVYLHMTILTASLVFKHEKNYSFIDFISIAALQTDINCQAQVLLWR